MCVCVCVCVLQGGSNDESQYEDQLRQRGDKVSKLSMRLDAAASDQMHGEDQIRSHPDMQVSLVCRGPVC